MDRNSPDPLRELDADTSANATKRWISACQEKGFSRVKPILTPRFIPTCTDELMEQLSEIQKQYQLPMQSHLSENIGEIAWVKELCPWSESYGEAYEHFGLFGKEVPTIMAHCVHSTKKEREKMLNNGVFIAHCPQSNTNLSSGIAPASEFTLKKIIGLDLEAILRRRDLFYLPCDDRCHSDVKNVSRRL